jgi:hypothetical protein
VVIGERLTIALRVVASLRDIQIFLESSGCVSFLLPRSSTGTISLSVGFGFSHPPPVNSCFGLHRGVFKDRLPSQINHSLLMI